MRILSCHSFAPQALKPIPYANNLRIDDLLVTIDTAGIAVLSGFPTDPGALLEFGRQIGVPSPKPGYSRGSSTTQNAAFEYVADVRYMREIPSSERRATQGNVEIRLHTARSFAVNRPRYFALLMAQPSVYGGTSTYGLVDRVLEVLGKKSPAAYSGYVSELSTTHVPWTHRNSPAGDAASTPLLSSIGTGRPQFRYWNGILETAAEHRMHKTFIDALENFDNALHDEATLTEVHADRGDLVIIDNNRVAHGRRAFSTEHPGSQQELQRQVYSMQVFGHDQPR